MENIQTYLDQFCEDQKTLYAVVRAIEIIGEAVKNISDEVCENYPEFPWSSVAKISDNWLINILA